MIQCLAKTAFLSAALAVASGSACAQGRPLDDAQLSDVWGQALIDLTNTSLNGYDFSRLTLNADITLSATLSGLKLGTHQSSGSSDIDISTISFGNGGTGTVSISNPYFEWVYSGTGASAQVVGMRLGFGSINGDVGLSMNTVSGTLSLDSGSTTTGTISGSGSQLSSLSGCSGTCSVALSQISGVTATNSTDFFLSILKAAVTYPATTTTGSTAAAQAGFWLNWTNSLKALTKIGP